MIFRPEAIVTYDGTGSCKQGNQMKRNIIIICVMMMAISVVAKEQNQGEIVVVDMSALVKAYPGTESSGAILKDQVEEFEAEKNDMMKRLEEKQEAIQKLVMQSEDDALSDEMAAKKKKEVEEEVMAFRLYRQDIMERLKLRQQQIGDEKRRLQKRIFENLSEIVAGHSKKKGYSMVIDVSALIYNKGSIDITKEVLKLVEKEKKD